LSSRASSSSTSASPRCSSLCSSACVSASTGSCSALMCALDGWRTSRHAAPMESMRVCSGSGVLKSSAAKSGGPARHIRRVTAVTEDGETTTTPRPGQICAEWLCNTCLSIWQIFTQTTRRTASTRCRGGRSSPGCAGLAQVGGAGRTELIHPRGPPLVRTRGAAASSSSASPPPARWGGLLLRGGLRAG